MNENEIFLSSVVKDLTKKDGIYYADSIPDISYPEKGNEHCFQVEDQSFWFKHRNNCIVKAVKKYSDSDVFFDIGGGNGFVSLAIEKEGLTSVLLEPGINGCLNARKRNISYIVCSTLEISGIKKGTIPAAGLFDVVEHIEDDRGFLENVHSFMKKDGSLFITVPAYKWLWSTEDIDAGHYRRYTTQSINAVLEKSGFKVIYSSYIFSILPIPIFLKRTLPTKFKFLQKKDKRVQRKKQHQSRRGALSSFVNSIFSWEVNRISNAGKIPFGSSCFVVARKV